MKKDFYYFIASVFYHLFKGDNIIYEHFHNKAESIAEDEYNEMVTKFYEG